MSAEPLIKKKRYTFEEYLKLEEQDQIRYEFYNGEVFAMAGGSLNHNNIALNISRFAFDALEQSGCRMFQRDVKLELKNSNAYVYPDIMVTCDPEDIQAEYLVKSPVLIAEVLSPSTASYDRDVKLYRYHRIPSLRYYLLVSQEHPYIEVYSRTQSIAISQYQTFEALDEQIHFPEMHFSLSLQQIYRNIRFPDPPEHIPGIFRQ